MFDALQVSCACFVRISASLRHDLADAHAQRDLAHVERDAAIDEHGVVIAERHAANSQLAVERARAISEIEFLAARLATADAQRDAALLDRDVATAARDAQAAADALAMTAKDQPHSSTRHRDKVEPIVRDSNDKATDDKHQAIPTKPCLRNEFNDIDAIQQL
ncbi:hypothetical protein BCR44DRAFT_411919 [Catenaria anguillulae PL171]|uniref:Uncharacterized protein n=1 Tax=Catenaria anguillulae PL171 TaxID=765915 RepID=A0A1Y2HEN7_9FUNG|nr:hypothetical protein BCR44DRAFT_411919 [Catenaria anguillulae PL171]